MMKKESCVIWTQTVSLYTEKQMIFIKKLQKMLKVDLILQIMNYTGHYQKEKIKKVIGLMEDELGGKIVTKFVGLRAKLYSYLIVDGSEDKKTKG